MIRTRRANPCWNDGTHSTHGMRVVMAKNWSNIAGRAHSERPLGRSDVSEGDISVVAEVEQAVEGDQAEQRANLR